MLSCYYYIYANTLQTFQPGIIREPQKIGVRNQQVLAQTTDQTKLWSSSVKCTPLQSITSNNFKITPTQIIHKYYNRITIIHCKKNVIYCSSSLVMVFLELSAHVKIDLASLYQSDRKSKNSAIESMNGELFTVTLEGKILAAYEIFKDSCGSSHKCRNKPERF